jgi:Na+/H+ antiporter NhaD/arsenite permease-like protein
MQDQVQSSPLKGFWLISAAAFFISPFLTNDGVCLLFVELILDAFEATKALSHKCDGELPSKSNGMQLETGDAIYFLLTLACSANIGSSLTYTGHLFVVISIFFHFVAVYLDFYHHSK